MPFRPQGLLILLLCLTTGCAALPTTSRTGTVHEITIAEGISPREVEVQPGDEVQLVNQRGAPVWVYFYRDSPDALSCQRGFTYYSGTKKVAKIEPSQSASLCFANPGVVVYLVQFQASREGGARLGATKISDAVPGVVLVKTP
jgi:plastocyanin